MCYPDSWKIAGHGYVSAGAEARWYSVGIILFDGERQLAHVSIYAVPQFARPLTYTRDCHQPYRVTFAGVPAVLCPDFPGQPPEARIVSYHVFKNDRDYFINVVPYFRYDAGSGKYTEDVDESALNTAFDIAGTFRFIDLPH